MPFSHTRPICEIRVGITTIKEKWEFLLDQKGWYETEVYLQELFPPPPQLGPVTLVNSALLASETLAEDIKALEVGQGLSKNGRLLAGHLPGFGTGWRKLIKPKEYKKPVVLIQKSYHIFQEAGAQIRHDLEIIKKHKQSKPFPDDKSILYGAENIFVEEGVKAKFCIINAENGPVYLGKNCEIQEGVMIKGPLALCEGSVLNMGAKLKGDNVIGPFCKVGGEVSNSVFFGYSNKAHDGFLGNSVIGEWCNLGADTNTSNLKNNYGPVKIYDYKSKVLQDTGLTFCGLAMGDHAKAGINTMFNTGTVVGIGANIFGADFPEKYVPAFSWGNEDEKYELDKFLEAESRVLARRNKQISAAYARMIKQIYTKK